MDGQSKRERDCVFVCLCVLVRNSCCWTNWPLTQGTVYDKQILC